MYKIYVNEKPFIFAKPSSNLASLENMPNVIKAPYLGKSKLLLSYVDMLLKSKTVQAVILTSDNTKKLRDDFFELMRIVPAAGGLVINEFDEILAIFRRGYWDLPKGKIEKKEGIKVGGIREVMEETGISDVKIDYKIGKTYHMFKLKDQTKAIKLTHWYLMKTKKQELIPQEEEDILKAKWVNLASFKHNCNPIYKNILEVIRKYEKKESKRI